MFTLGLEVVGMMGLPSFLRKSRVVSAKKYVYSKYFDLLNTLSDNDLISTFNNKLFNNRWRDTLEPRREMMRELTLLRARERTYIRQLLKEE
jgi:hypothetical protein